MNIIELAKEANGEPAGPGGVDWTWDELERFAKLVAAREREACAKVCEQPIDEIQVTDTISEVVYMDAHECAEAIRARGTT